MVRIVAAAVIAAAAHAAIWFSTHQSVSPPDLDSLVASVSFQPFRADQDPTANDVPTAEQINHDLAVVADVSRSVRTYSSTGGLEQVPALARRHGLNAVIGAWVDKDEARNKREIESAVELARANRNVKGLIVGNETILREDKTADEMIQLIRQVKKRVKVPVSTGEVWHVWMKHPKLVAEVDFIAVHMLPYWEGVPADKAVEYAFTRYEELRKTYPGKRIVIAEFGWPSQGYNNKWAQPSPLAQAATLRQFISEANARGIEYNLVEAFDQPWKTNEGSVGPYWGMFDANRHLKFSLFGDVERDRSAVGATALALGALLTLLGLLGRRPTFGHALAFAAPANAVGAGVAVAAFWPFQNYLNFGGAMMWGVGFALMLCLSIMTLAKAHDIAAILFGRRPSRLVRPGQMRPLGGRARKVSIHIPAYKEQPEMLKQTLDSVAALDYPNFEAVVVINNTPDEQYWKPIEEHCRALGGRFKFLNIPKLAGFKAGALNEALKATADDAEIIAVIDADYVVDPDWLKHLTPGFDDPRVALVQAPQDHRDGGRSMLKGMMNGEYMGFFDIGMVQRNEADAIITHGTMCMIRRSALMEVGGWGSDTIVEDTELGLRLFEAGYGALYTNRRYGWGLLPDTYRAFKVQRERWAYGAVQIIKKHWRHMLPGSRTLTSAQKVNFVAGWTFWLSDAFGALAAVMNLLWVPVVILVGVIIPTIELTIPIIAAFVVNVLHCGLLYAKRVDLPLHQVPGAAIAAMSLQLTVARAVLKGFVQDNLPFHRTDKGGAAKAKTEDQPARAETIIGLLLLAAAAALEVWNSTEIREVKIFEITLLVQAIPFLAAGVMRSVERGEGWLAARRARVARPSGARRPTVAAKTVRAA
jgi:exo-beta-1,3-glucanase (GH17 family)/cellulose synthase/poly-beta-1,6-N-acetylglucosamine synthase-like glycosyltransferase